MKTNITFKDIKDHQILDTRSEQSVARSSIKDSYNLPYFNIPYHEIVESEVPSEIKKDRPLAVICGQGITSEVIAAHLRKLGYDAYSVEGGMNAWGKYYETVHVSDSITQVIRPSRGCLGYVCTSNDEAVVIDPSHHLETYRQLLKGKKLKFVLDTHVHADHISGGLTLAKEFGVPYTLHPYDGIHPLDMLPSTFEYTYLKDGDTLHFGNSTLKVLHVPGHTLGNLAFLLDNAYLFTGDSIFLNSIARPDLGGKGDAWAPLHYDSLRHLLTLDDKIVILPSHFSGIEEKQTNGTYSAPFKQVKETNGDLKMAQKSKEEFVAFILASLPDFPKEYIEIKRVNLGLSSPTEEKMAELEMGKNLCALSKK